MIVIPIGNISFDDEATLAGGRVLSGLHFNSALPPINEVRELIAKRIIEPPKMAS